MATSSPPLATPATHRPPSDTPPAAASRSAGVRIASLDIVRGVVMVLMAIDHVRVYSGVPAGGPTPGIFFTRWVTHFCAPAFVFLAGTAAFMHGRALGDTRALSRYLLTRGALLVVLELTLIHLSWTFSLGSMTSLLAGVIWMLGWCMILMAAIIRLPVWAIATFGLTVIFGQNAFGSLAGAMPASLGPSLGWLWQFLYLGGDVGVGAVSVSVLYSIVPWIGVMAAGYAFGAILLRKPAERRRLCLTIGLSATAVFIVAAGLSVLLSAPAEGGPPTLIRMLNQRKYPASQLFLLMTLGPTIAFLPLLESARGAVARFFETFGRVPMFYYLLHIPLIHVMALGVFVARDGRVNTAPFDSAPYVSMPPEQRWSLALLYLVFAAAIAILYLPCRRYAEVKAKAPRPWMRYV
jgi:uncharacterized membrane protein